MSKRMQPVEPAERVKIAELQKESAEKSNKVEWLYSGDKLDRNAYLLGKPIDKLLIEKEIDKPKEDIFSNTVDLASKIREDPLFEIKKQEIEAKKKLLENPLRIKQIKAMISKDRDADFEDENYRDRRRDRRDERVYDRNDRDRRRHRSSSSEHDSRKHKRKHERNKQKSSSSRSRSRSRDRRDERSSNKYGLSSRDSEHKRKQSKDDDEQHSKSSIHKEIEETKRKIERLKQIRQSDQSSVKQTHSAAPSKNATKKLSDEEKQRRLQEMQENAKWRADVRSTNIKRYKSDAKLEEKLEKESNSRDSQLEASHHFNSMMRDAYSSTEDRIKRNIKNVQRNQSSFDSNFARKY